MINAELDDVVADEVLRERIRGLIHSSPSSGFTRLLKHPLGTAVLGFLLTTAAGATITSCYQSRSQEIAREAAMRESRRDAAMVTFRDVGRTMDRRLFWGGQFYDALSTDTSTARRQQLAVRFDSTIWAWRESYSTNVAAVCRYFGPEASRLMTDRIGDKFSRFGRGIREYALTDALAPRDLYPLYDSLRTEILAFDMLLVEMVRTGNVGDIAAGPCGDRSRTDTVSRTER